LSALYSIDGGAPYRRLMTLAQRGVVGEQELNDARLMAMLPKVVNE